MDHAPKTHRSLGYLALALLMTTIAVGGFMPTYWVPLMTGSTDYHWLIHLHGGVFTVWMLLLVAQAGLVFRGRTDLHLKLGNRVGIGWGVFLVLIGLAVAFGRLSPAIGTEYESLEGFIEQLPVPLGDLATFAILFGVGIALRKKPETHKRLMILATATLLFAPAARLIGPAIALTGSPWVGFATGYGLPLLPAFVAIGHDVWTRSRVHPAYAFGTGLLVLEAVRLMFIFRSETWPEMAARIAAELRAVLAPLL